MAEWHGYVLLELKPGLPLTTAQKGKVRDTVRGLAVREEHLPNRMFQARLSLDGSQAIYEAVWDRAKVGPAAVMVAVAAALGVAPGLLNDNVSYWLFADGGSWDESRVACLAYLHANLELWEPET